MSAIQLYAVWNISSYIWWHSVRCNESYSIPRTAAIETGAAPPTRSAYPPCFKYLTNRPTGNWKPALCDPETFFLICFCCLCRVFLFQTLFGWIWSDGYGWSKFLIPCDVVMAFCAKESDKDSAVWSGSSFYYHRRCHPVNRGLLP